MSSSEASPLKEPGGLTPNSLWSDARRCSSVGWCRSGVERPVGEVDFVLVVLSSCDLPLRQVARRSSCSLEGKLACSPHASRAKPRFRLKGCDVTEVRTDQLQASEICRLAEFAL